MKFRHRIELVNINGLKEYSVQYFLTEQLSIGRGASCELKLPDRLVFIRHALLSTNPDDSLRIRDLTEGKGILKVNGRKTRERNLKKGDKLQIGRTILEVFFDGTYWGFRETRLEKDQSKIDGDLNTDLAKLDFARFLPRQLTLSLLCMSLVVLFFFAEPFKGRRMMLWSPGPISNVHKLTGANCETCHKVDFQSVRDKECLSCHRLADHAQSLPVVFQSHPELQRRCAECHLEHKGHQKPFTNGSQECIRCHAQPSVLPKGSNHPKVATFDAHPEFRVSTVSFLGNEEREVIRSILGPEVKDSTRLAFGHKLHMKKGLRGLIDEESSLTCRDCHRLAPNRREILPLTYQGQCASCHSLGFDERLPKSFVPHGNSSIVYNFIYAEYSKLFLVTEQRNERMATVRRLKPGSTVIDEPDLQFTRDFVESESRNAEREIFTRTSCKVCHQVVEKKDKKAGESWYTVLPPFLPSRWLPNARFDHGAHENVSCVSCHSKAPESSKTTDLLLPGVETCKSCHSSHPQHPVKVDSPCITCHSFHDPLRMDDKDKRTVADFLLGR